MLYAGPEIIESLLAVVAGVENYRRWHLEPNWNSDDQFLHQSFDEPTRQSRVRPEVLFHFEKKHYRYLSSSD